MYICKSHLFSVFSIFQLERELSESSGSLKGRKERVAELEQRVSYLEKVILYSASSISLDTMNFIIRATK